MVYDIGEAKKAALKCIPENELIKIKDFKGSNSPKIEEFNLDSKLKPLITYQNSLKWIGMFYSCMREKSLVMVDRKK